MPLVASDPSWRLGVVLQCHAALLAYHRLGEAATRMATELSLLLPCDEVVIALAAPRGTRVLAFAHGNGNPASIEASAPYLAALDEAMDQQCRVEAPATRPDALQIRRAHLALSRTRSQWVCTQPMVSDSRVIGAILITRSLDAPLSDEATEVLNQVAQLAAPVIERLDQDSATLPRRLLRALRGHRPESGRHRWLLPAALLVFAVSLIPLPMSVPAHARIEGAVQRVVTAPEDGFIEQALVRPGDTVSEGQVLVELADERLKVERDRLMSALQEQDNGFTAALASDDRGQMAVHRARQGEIRAQIAHIDHALAQSQVRAPMDSVVLSGQLDQATGAPVSRGDVLLMLAPRHAYRLMLEVDERDARSLMSDRPGQLRLTGLPYETLDFRVTRILPVTEQADGRHFVRMEGAIDHPPDALAPGMEGVARIDAGSAPALFQVTRRVRQWLSLRLWMLTGL